MNLFLEGPFLPHRRLKAGHSNPVNMGVFIIQIDGVAELPLNLSLEYRIQVEQRVKMVAETNFKHGEITETDVVETITEDGEEVIWEIHYNYETDPELQSNNPTCDMENEIVRVNDQLLKDILDGGSMPN